MWSVNLVGFGEELADEVEVETEVRALVDRLRDRKISVIRSSVVVRHRVDTIKAGTADSWLKVMAF